MGWGGWGGASFGSATGMGLPSEGWAWGIKSSSHPALARGKSHRKYFFQGKAFYLKGRNMKHRAFRAPEGSWEQWAARRKRMGAAWSWGRGYKAWGRGCTAQGRGCMARRGSGRGCRAQYHTRASSTQLERRCRLTGRSEQPGSAPGLLSGQQTQPTWLVRADSSPGPSDAPQLHRGRDSAGPTLWGRGQGVTALGALSAGRAPTRSGRSDTSPLDGMPSPHHAFVPLGLLSCLAAPPSPPSVRRPCWPFTMLSVAS